jgi:hypothetical protein
LIGLKVCKILKYIDKLDISTVARVIQHRTLREQKNDYFSGCFCLLRRCQLLYYCAFFLVGLFPIEGMRG